MKGILCSTGAFNRKELSADIPKLISLYPQLMCDGYELLLSSHWTEEQAAQCLSLTEAGIIIPVVHLSKKIGRCLSSGSEDSLKEAYKILHMNCRILQALQVKQAVVHLWGFPDSCFDYVLRGYKEAVSMCASYGIEPLAETLPCSERPLPERMRQLAEANPGCRFTLDSRHLRYNDLTESIFNEDWLWNEKRAAHVHISDCSIDSEGRVQIKPLHPGEGAIDFKAFFKNLSEKKYNDYITLESTAELINGEISTAKVKASLLQIREYAGKAGL